MKIIPQEYIESFDIYANITFGNAWFILYLEFYEDEYDISVEIAATEKNQKACYLPKSGGLGETCEIVKTLLIHRVMLLPKFIKPILFGL